MTNENEQVYFEYDTLEWNESVRLVPKSNKKEGPYDPNPPMAIYAKDVPIGEFAYVFSYAGRSIITPDGTRNLGKRIK